jgi:multidrug efflux pump subunit AcrB
VLSGQVLTMNTSFQNLEIGIEAAVIFVYLLMAMNFQSWTDPFIILTALPGAFAGIVWMLFLTQHVQCAVLNGGPDDHRGGDGKQHTSGDLRE